MNKNHVLSILDFLWHSIVSIAFWSPSVLFVMGVVPDSVFANDSEAGLFGGQLELKKSEQIVMESEDLFISLDQVKVHYTFKNVGKSDVDTTVAFPMP